MRTNSKIRFGVMALAAALLLFLIWLLFLRGRPVEPVATTPGGINAVGGTAPTPVSQNTAWESIGPIPDRTILSPALFRQVSLPDGASAENYISAPEEIRGFITSRSLPARARLQRADLLGHITELGVAGAVRPGLRAQVVPIVNKATLHDLIRIGDYVDVIASFDQEESRAIVQNVRVLAVDTYGRDFPQQLKIGARGAGRADSPGVPGAPTPTPTAAPQGGAPPAPEAAVTLEVTPQQAAALSLAQAVPAPLDLVLRPRPSVTEVVLNTGVGGTGNSVSGAPIAVGALRRNLAPTAYRVKRNTPATTPRTASAPRGSGSGTSGGSGGGGGGGNSGFTRSPQPQPDFTTPNIPPAPLNGGATTINTTPPAPETYKIPIYGDGKIVREDEVLKP